MKFKIGDKVTVIHSNGDTWYKKYEDMIGEVIGIEHSINKIYYYVVKFNKCTVNFYGNQLILIEKEEEIEEENKLNDKYNLVLEKFKLKDEDIEKELYEKKHEIESKERIENLKDLTLEISKSFDECCSFKPCSNCIYYLPNHIRNNQCKILYTLDYIYKTKNVED